VSAESNNHANNIELAELESIMKTPSGRAVLFRILGTTGYFQDSFHTDTNMMIRKTCMRSVGVRLVDQMMQCNDQLFYLMLSENDNDR